MSQSERRKWCVAIEDKEIAKLLKFLISKLYEIRTSNPREGSNKNYHRVSIALIHIFNKYDVASNHKAYSCPMVKKIGIQNSRKMSKLYSLYLIVDYKVVIIRVSCFVWVNYLNSYEVLFIFYWLSGLYTSTSTILKRTMAMTMTMTKIRKIKRKNSVKIWGS